LKTLDCWKCEAEAATKVFRRRNTQKLFSVTRQFGAAFSSTIRSRACNGQGGHAARLSQQERSFEPDQFGTSRNVRLSLISASESHRSSGRADQVSVAAPHGPSTRRPAIENRIEPSPRTSIQNNGCVAYRWRMLIRHQFTTCNQHCECPVPLIDDVLIVCRGNQAVLSVCRLLYA
jgi:hypothetical protein